MKITFLITLTLLNILIFNQGCVQQSIDYKVINLLSLENKKVTVKLFNDAKNDRYILELNKSERMCIPEEMGLAQDIKIHDNKFMEFQIAVRGGTGEQIRRYSLICISNGNFYKSIDIISLVKNTITGISEFEVNCEGPIEKNGTYEMSIGGKKFNFDNKNKVFFDDYYTLNGSYYINTDKDPVRKEKVFQNEKCPIVFLKYIFIEKKWYILDNSYLEEITSNCN